MTFTCDNELELSGGSEGDRRAAAALLLASDSAEEDSATSRQSDDSLILRFRSVDGIPEGELASLSAQFPELAFLLIYFSLDGEFFGYAKTGAEAEAAESEDFDEETRDAVGRLHDGDGIAFVRERYALARA